jgi:hypothetical protein
VPALGVSMRRSAGHYLERFSALARGAFFDLETLCFYPQASSLRAPFGLARCNFGGSHLDFAQPRKDAIEACAGLRKRGMRGELSLA